MGDPKKHRKKYQGPSHPWQRTRIEEEKVLVRDYGLKNKTEIWKMNSYLKRFKSQAKRLATVKHQQDEIERQHLLRLCNKYGFIVGESDVGDILAIDLKKVLERRLQTLLFRKGLARSIDQARQYITHGHVTVQGKKMNSPSYLVPLADEMSIAFIVTSALSNTDHPERRPFEKKVKAPRPVQRDDRRGGRNSFRRAPPRQNTSPSEAKRA
ncbi:30S ribosomal protein S4 [Candidatus Woesearchaeota archaeon]|nr:30S ribosomal protein S4 [Candidatus Woesearchaeota archaeon]